MSVYKNKIPVYIHMYVHICVCGGVHTVLECRYWDVRVWPCFQQISCTKAS